MYLQPQWLWSILCCDWALLQKQLINQKKGNRICWCGRAPHFKCVGLWPPQWGNIKSLQLPGMWHCFAHAGKGEAKGIVQHSNCCTGLNAEQFCSSQEQGMVGRTGHSRVIAGCDCPSFSFYSLTQPSNTTIIVLWTPVSAKHSLVCKISAGVTFNAAARCIQAL